MVSFFTPIDLAKGRKSSCSEVALSLISNYFYLGGNKIKVFNKNNAKVLNDKVHWLMIAVKVVSYVALFPLTFALLLTDYGLRRKHKYTIIKNQKEPQQSITKNDPISPSKPESTNNTNNTNNSNCKRTGSSIDTGITTTPAQMEASSEVKIPVENMVQDAVDVVRTSSLIKKQSLKEKPFQAFEIKYDNKTCKIRSNKEFRQLAQTLTNRVLITHIALKVAIPFGAKALDFYNKLGESLEINPIKGRDHEYILTPKVMAQHDHENLRVYYYNNGVIEQVESLSDGTFPTPSQDWKGQRIRPDGAVAKGSFRAFELHSGKIIKREEVFYREPDFVITSPLSILGIIKDTDSSQFVVIQHQSHCIYVPSKIELIPALAEIITKEYVSSQFLLDNFPEQIEDLIKHISEQDMFVSIVDRNLLSFLEIVRDKKLKVDLRSKSLFDKYLGDQQVIDLLLALDPTLQKELQEAKIREFKNNIKNASTYKFDEKSKNYIDRNPIEIADKIFNNIPEGVTHQQIVEFIFKSNYDRSISPLLSALQFKFPDYKLSPYDLIRKAIADDEKITNDTLNKMLKEHNLEQDEDKINFCYDLAYRLGRPYIYRESQVPVQSNEYTLNFIWVNLNPQDRQSNTAQNIFNDGLDLSENAEIVDNADSDYMKENLTARLSKWVKANPDTQINLWYDSALVTENARKMTLEKLGKISKDIHLKDVRALPNVIKDKDITNALHPATPVYFRVDMIKTLVADHMMNGAQDDAKYCVISDFDVEPMAPKHLFDQRTKDYLAKTGFVANKVYSKININFFIFNKENLNIKETFYKYTIENSFKNRLKKQRKNAISSKTFQATYFVDSYSSYFKSINKGIYSSNNRKKLSSRKVVASPYSIFRCTSFSEKDHRSEYCYFMGDEDVPYTENGRNHTCKNKSSQIQELKDWKAEPLPQIEA